MKIEQGVSLRISAPEFFKDPEFVKWLNNGDRKFTWHDTGEPDGWSDVVVAVDPSLSGEGSDDDMPAQIWEQIVQACRDNIKNPAITNGVHILVWLTPV